MFVALSADPVATELDSLKKFLLGCKLCKNDEEIETYIRNAYTLYPKDDLESEEINKEQDKKPEEVDPENLQSTNDELSDIDGNLELLKVEKVEK